MESSLLTVGSIYILGLAVFHGFFWKLFDWKNDLKQLNYINQRVMPLLNLCLTFLFLAFAYISFFHQSELLTTDLGKTIIFIIAFLLLLRFILQFVYFGFRPKSNYFAAIIFIGFLTYGWVLYLIRG